jgi:putative peptidoglycan lipid II flippase
MLLLVNLTRIMFPAVCFTALAGVLSGILNSYRHFLGPALGPNIYNIGIILAAALLGSHFGIQGMAFGVVLGAIGNFVTQLIFLPQCGGQFYQFGYIDLKNPGFRRMLILWIPALIGLSADQVNIWATTIMASALPEGGITAIRFANRLIQLPIGVFAAGISMAFFPLLSGLATEKKLHEYKETLSLSLRSIFFIMLPSGVALIVLRYPIVQLLFERQKFTPHDTMLTAYALLFYSLTIFAHAAILMLPRAFYALQDTRTPVIIGAFSVSASIFFNWLFLKYTSMGVGGFALSFSIMGLINMLLLVLVLRKKIHGMRGGEIGLSFAKSFIASLMMGIGILALNKLIQQFNTHLSTHLGAAILILAGVVFGSTIYLVSAWFLKMEELELMIKLFKRRLKWGRAE